MPKLRTLIKAVCGFPTTKTLDGRPLPVSVQGWTPVVVVHDRRLSAGIFSTKRRWKKQPVFRLLAWRTYRDRKGQERATTVLHRDEIEPVMKLLKQCNERFSVV